MTNLPPAFRSRKSQKPGPATSKVYLHSYLTDNTRSSYENGVTTITYEVENCDERYPCFHCSRHNVLCSFPSANLRPITTKLLGASVSQGTSSPKVSKAVTVGPPEHNSILTSEATIDFTVLDNLMLPISSTLDKPRMRDLELMHHFCTFTCETLARRKDMQHVWRMVFPQEGYASVFVMHGLLALAALHKAHLLQEHRQMYLALSAYHQNLGLKDFRPLLGSIYDDNWKPIFCFASIIVCYMCALPARCDGYRLPEPIRNVLELTAVNKGVGMIIEPLMKNLVNTNMVPLAYGMFVADRDSSSESDDLPEYSCVPSSMLKALDSLCLLFEPNVIPPLTRSAYEITLLELRRTVKLVAWEGLNVEIAMVLRWLYHIPQIVIDDMHLLKPHALLFLAYFAVLIDPMEEYYWFCRGWGKQLFADIDSRLGGSDGPWAELLAWPRKHVAVGRR